MDEIQNEPEHEIEEGEEVPLQTPSPQHQTGGSEEKQITKPNSPEYKHGVCEFRQSSGYYAAAYRACEHLVTPGQTASGENLGNAMVTLRLEGEPNDVVGHVPLKYYHPTNANPKIVLRLRDSREPRISQLFDPKSADQLSMGYFIRIRPQRDVENPSLPSLEVEVRNHDFSSSAREISSQQAADIILGMRTNGDGVRGARRGRNTKNNGNQLAGSAEAHTQEAATSELRDTQTSPSTVGVSAPTGPAEGVNDEAAGTHDGDDTDSIAATGAPAAAQPGSSEVPENASQESLREMREKLERAEKERKEAEEKAAAEAARADLLEAELAQLRGQLAKLAAGNDTQPST
jgi:hypothetical protein